GRVHSRELADELQRRGPNLLVGRGRLEVEQRFDVATHAVKSTPRYVRTLPPRDPGAPRRLRAPPKGTFPGARGWRPSCCHERHEPQDVEPANHEEKRANPGRRGR